MLKFSAGKARYASLRKLRAKTSGGRIVDKNGDRAKATKR
jgi:hypothetical protein